MDTDTEPTSTHILPASFSLFSLIAEEDKSALSLPTAFSEAPTVQRIPVSTPHPAPPSLPPPPTPPPPRRNRRITANCAHGSLQLL